MKKLLALFLAGIMLFSLASCDLKEKSAEVLVQAYVELAQTTDEWKQAEETSKNAGMDLAVEARGTNLVYMYTFTVELEDNAAELLKTSLEESAESLKASAETIRGEQSAIDKVIWEYYDMEGNLLASAEH